MLLVRGKESCGVKQTEEENGFFEGVGYIGNGLVVLTLNGKKVEGVDVWAALRQWKRTPAEERRTLEELGRHDPDLYPPKPPAGGLILRMYRRALEKSDAGRWVRPERIFSKEGTPLSSDPQLDHLWLTSKEVMALNPAGRQPGKSFEVFSPVTDRLERFHFIDATTGITEQWYWKPDEVIDQRMTLTVEAVTEERVELRLQGSASYAPIGRPEERVTYQVRGQLTFDARAQSFTRFDVTALSEEGHFERATKKRQGMGVTFELARPESPADRIPPFFINENGYWKPSR